MIKIKLIEMDLAYFYQILIVLCALGIIFCVHQLFYTSNTLVEFREFEDYATSYNKIFDPNLRKKVRNILLTLLKKDEKYLHRSPRSWERLGLYMQRMRAYISIEERDEYAPHTVSPEALYMRCGDFLKSSCGNTFYYSNTPEVTKRKAERALTKMHSKGAFHMHDPAYILLEHTFGRQVNCFIKMYLRQEALHLKAENRQDFLKRIKTLGFFPEEFNLS